MVLPSASDLAELRAYVRDARTTLLGAAAADAGPVARLWTGRPTVVLKRPEDVAHVLAVHARAYAKTPRLLSGRAGRIAGNGALTASEADAQRYRLPVQRVLKQPRVEDARTVVARRADRFAASLRDGQLLDVEAATRALAIDVVVDALFGTEAPEALRAGVALRRELFERAMHAALALPRSFPLSLRPSARAALRRFDAALDDALRDPRGVLLRGIVAAVGPERAREEAFTIAVTGHNTIAAGLASSIRHAVRDPSVATRLREAGEPYADMVVAEALRLAPPTWVIVRVAQTDDRLPSGATVARGDKVLISPLVLHHDPSLWPDPERFDPERFAPEVRPRVSRFAYLPFGTGTHACIGKHFALLEMAVALTTLAERFDLEPAGDGKVRLRAVAPVEVAA